jgi:hypothetical protein
MLRGMKLPAFLAALLLPVLLAAAPYRVGDKLEAFTTKDQHDRSYTLDGSARLLVVSFAMKPGKAVNAFLEEQPAGFLDQHHALYLANIYGMPSIGRVFALPKMRKYPHRILLADAEGFLDRYPQQEDKVTVLSLDPGGVITAIRFVDPKKEIASVFAATP